MLGRAKTGETVRLALTLPLRNQGELNVLLENLYDPDNAQYGHYLTSEQFAARYSPTQADYDAVIAFARRSGLQVVGTHPNRLVVDVQGTSLAVERAFAVSLQRFQAPDGRIFRAPNADPAVPAALSGKIAAIVGLDNVAVFHPHNVLRNDNALFGNGQFQAFADPRGGSGPSGGYTPSDIKTAYGLSGLSQTGTGQTLALFELDGYKASDITAYESYFGLANVPLQNVLVDGYSGASGSGAGEVTLDIELQIALAPGASKILVYEGPNSSAGVIDTYNKIATDNLAKSISTSWGLAEGSNSASALSSENSIFQQMATQGQSIFAAAGDSGAYDNGGSTSLAVDDPASQPYMTGVGGTSLTTGTGGTYTSETTWNRGSASNGAGGGGISTKWTIPSWQQGLALAANSKVSTTQRNVPDVALNADPYTGYSIYFGGKWVVYGGTSCAAPLWSAFAALVNQQRVATGKATLGFVNPTIYSIGKGSTYSSDFHDIADGSTNLYYPAVTGFDAATGWGSFKGAGLLADLAGGTGGGTTVPAAPTGLTATAGNAQVSLAWSASSGATSYNLYRATSAGAEALYKSGLTATTYADTGLTNGTTYYYKVAAVNSAGTSGLSAEASATPSSGGGTVTQLLGNPGFENGSSSPAPWVVSSGVIDSSTSQAAHGGSWKAWMDGYGSAHTDSLYQPVTIPSAITSATLSFYLHIDTAETTTTTAYDKLTVQVRNSAGTVLTTLATYSNLNKATGYALKTFNLSAYKGQTVQIYLVGTEDSSLQTSFVVDDFALNVQ